MTPKQKMLAVAAALAAGVFVMRRSQAATVNPSTGMPTAGAAPAPGPLGVSVGPSVSGSSGSSGGLGGLLSSLVSSITAAPAPSYSAPAPAVSTSIPVHSSVVADAAAAAGMPAPYAPAPAPAYAPAPPVMDSATFWQVAQSPAPPPPQYGSTLEQASRQYIDNTSFSG